MAAEFGVLGAVWSDVIAEADALTERWIVSLRARGQVGESELLAGLQRDPESFEFTRRLLEMVVGTEDAFASAVGFREVAQDIPRSLSTRDRLAVRAGGAASLGLPWAVMPVARKWLRDRVSQLVLATKLPGAESKSARLGHLADALKKHRDLGVLPVIAPIGEQVHGPRGAEVEIQRLTALAAHHSVDRIAVDPSRVAPGGNDWTAEDDVRRAAAALRPILDAAVEHDTAILLQPTSVRWARLLPEVVVHALADPALDEARIGVQLMAELPEAREHYDRLSRWAQRRVSDGGAPAEVVVGVSGVAASERIASIQSGLPVPVIEQRDEVTAQLLRLVALALHPGRAQTLRPIVATEDVFVLGAVAALAQMLGTDERWAAQLRGGIAPGLAEVLAAGKHTNPNDVRVVIPVIAPKEFMGAVDPLVRFAAEAADDASVISRFDALVRDPELIDTTESERTALRRAIELAAEDAPASHRTQLRAQEWDPSERDSALFYRPPDETAAFDTGGLTAAVLGLIRGSTGAFELEEFAPTKTIPVVSESGFANEPSTDATLSANRGWARELLERSAEVARDRDTQNATVELSPADIDPVAAAQSAREAAALWNEHANHTRARLLRRAALAVVAARDRLLLTLAADTGAPISELDAEIDDTVDAARYSGQLAERLDGVRGASFQAEGLVLVAAVGGTPLSVQAEAVLAALAAGNGVLWSVPQRLFRSAAALLEEWEIGGLTPGTVRLEALAVGEHLADIAAAPQVDRAIVLGGRGAARELAKRRPDLRVEGRFAARGSIAVAPSADVDAAISDIVASAFRGAGSDPRVAQMVLTVGSISRSKRFRDGLVDAVRALRVGDTAHPNGADPLGFEVGPLASPLTEAGERALTQLGKGEEWLLRPEMLDDAGRIWSPGVRSGVSADAPFWDDARGVPVIGIVSAHSIGDAAAKQSAAGTGAVAGLQANDDHEILEWVELVEAAALSVNRPTVAARIERQPSGGWNDASMGSPALSGGPNRLMLLGSWGAREGTRSETLHLRGLDPEVQLLIEAAQDVLAYEEFDLVRRAALSDALAWRTTYGVQRDAIGLGIERNLLRYVPVVTHIRLAEGGSLASLVRVVAAALIARAPVSVSTGEVLPHALSGALEKLAVEVSLERDDDWFERLAVSGPRGANGAVADRVRLIDGNRVRAAEWMGGLDRAALWAEPVTMAGPVELMTMLREQSISARAHRHSLAISVPGLDDALSSGS